MGLTQHASTMPLLCSIVIVGLFFIAQGETPMRLTSSSFHHNTPLPKIHAFTQCGGNNLSPALSWDGVPEHTQSIALITSDPDAPHHEFIHWVMHTISPHSKYLPAGIPKERAVAQGIQGINDFGHIGYDGPCPPSGTHRYIFTLYALDTVPPSSEAPLSAKELRNLMKGHILATASYIGTFSAPEHTKEV